MASGGRSERVYHQDYIARIRYSNTLPPPPNPPKLLNIPDNALEYFTSPAFASRMAREQPINIEADAELGMPIDLIGLPGVFEGNEKALWGLDPPPQPHPHDRPLLRPLASLAKGSKGGAGVSFLRRTEYISADAKRNDSTPVKADNRKRKRPDVSREDDPIRMVRDIVKGFDIAYPEDIAKGEETTSNVRGSAITAEERKAWSQPRHPGNPTLQVVDAYPLIPEFELPDAPYAMVKFSTNPVASQEFYDPRLDIALLKPLDQTEEQIAERRAAQAAHDADPTLPEPGPLSFDYDFYLPDNRSLVPNIQARWDPSNPTRNDDALYRADDGDDSEEPTEPHFRFKRVRAYETQKITANELDNPYDEMVAVALHDPEDDEASGRTPRPKAAYLYGIASRSQIRPKRTTGPGVRNPRDPASVVHEIDVSIVDPVEETLEMRAMGRAEVFGEGVGA